MKNLIAKGIISLQSVKGLKLVVNHLSSSSSAKEKVYYTGFVGSKGYREGLGAKYYEDGQIEEAYWSNNTRNGFCRTVFSNEDVEISQQRNDKKV